MVFTINTKLTSISFGLWSDGSLIPAIQMAHVARRSHRQHWLKRYAVLILHNDYNVQIILKIHTCKHWRMLQVCFALPGPPNLTISWQNTHSPQSDLWQASHFLHLWANLKIYSCSTIKLINDRSKSTWYACDEVHHFCPSFRLIQALVFCKSSEEYLSSTRTYRYCIF